METVVVSKVMSADPAAVWRVLTEIDRYPIVMGTIFSVKRTEGTGYAVGVKWEETRRVVGRTSTLAIEVVDMEENSFTLQRASANEGNTSTRRDIEVVPEGTKVTFSFAATKDAQGTWAKIFGAVSGRVSIKIIKEIFERDLHDIEAAAVYRN